MGNNNQNIGSIINSNLTDVNTYKEQPNTCQINKGTTLKWNIVILYIIMIISLSMSIIALCRQYPSSLSFDYNGIIVAILSLLVAVLVGWNIYQLIDFNEKNKQISVLGKRFEEELNYIHNKTDYNQAIVYAIISQNSSAYFASNEDSVMKYQMIYKGIVALKILSNYPNCDKEISSLSDTLIKGLQNSSTILLNDKIKTDLLVMCGEINNKNKIPEFDKIVEFVKNS